MPDEGGSGNVRDGGYWYPDSAADAVGVLNLLREYREAERRMRSRTRDSMGMGETDLAAVRFLLRETQAGRVVRQRDLADALDITTPSTTVLVDRLCRDGYAQRAPHPHDRRSVVIRPTRQSEEEVRSAFGNMHRRMLAAAESLTGDERAAVTKFLKLMTECLE